MVFVMDVVCAACCFFSVLIFVSDYEIEMIDWIFQIKVSESCSKCIIIIIYLHRALSAHTSFANELKPSRLRWSHTVQNYRRIKRTPTITKARLSRLSGTRNINLRCIKKAVFTIWLLIIAARMYYCQYTIRFNTIPFHFDVFFWLINYRLNTHQKLNLSSGWCYGARLCAAYFSRQPFLLVASINCSMYLLQHLN